MSRFIRILLSIWISGFLLFSLNGCQNRAPSLRMLERRSGYGAGFDDDEVALYQKAKNSNQSLVRKSAPRVARIYVHPHELPSKDYFWGGYISLVVSPDEWILDQKIEIPAIQSTPTVSQKRRIK